MQEMDTVGRTGTGGSAPTVFRTKSVELILGEAERPEFQLRRVLGPVQLTLLGIGGIIGAGIFATIGTAAAGDAHRPGAGPGLTLSFALTAVVCSFTALCYAEFAGMVPISGSAYTYSYATLGELVAWVIGWDLIIEYAVGNVAVAVSWANYFKTFLEGFGLHIPTWLTMDYRTAAKIPGVFESAPHLFGVPIVFNVLAVAIVAVMTLILIWGIRESSGFNAVMVAIKIVVLTFFLVVGLFWVQPGNWRPFAPNGWSGVSAGAAIIFFAYIGFDAVSTVAEETRQPQRNLPIGIIGSLIICTFFYVAVSAVFTGLISYTDLRSSLATEQAEPLTLALQHVARRSGRDLSWAVGIVAFGSVVAHTAVLLVFQLGQPRIFFSMARDGLLPPAFRRVHHRFRTPFVGTLLTGLFVGSFAGIATIDEMVDLTNIGTLFAFILVCAGTIVLRVRDPFRPRPFRVPSGWFWAVVLYAAFAVGMWFLPLSTTFKTWALALAAVVFPLARNHIFPVLGILSCLYLIYFLPPTSWLRFAAWLNLGFVIYAGYGSVHSRLTGRPLHENPAEHDAHAAQVGAWLAVLGAAMLLFTRGFDLWVAAARAGGSWRELLRPGPWLEVSWFLIVPLLLNALLLCPMTIRRAWRADSAVRAGSRSIPKSCASALWLATLVAVGSVLYVVLVARFHIRMS